MPSFISNFKERLRLPRLFFRRPSRAEQIHGGPPLEFERPIPPVPWRGITGVVCLFVVAAPTGGELYCWPISPTTKVFTALLFAALFRDCTSRRQGRRRWISAGKS